MMSFEENNDQNQSVVEFTRKDYEAELTKIRMGYNKRILELESREKKLHNLLCRLLSHIRTERKSIKEEVETMAS